MMQQRKIELRDIVIIGMLAAICVIATTIKIPYGHGAMLLFLLLVLSLVVFMLD